MNANAMAVFTYLRVLADHLDNNLAGLRAKEVAFCVSVLTQKVITKAFVLRSIAIRFFLDACCNL